MTAQDRPGLLVELGTVDYGRALQLQRALVRLRQADEITDTLVLLQHPPVVTIGRNADRSNLLVSDAELARRGVELFRAERGGDITFHGPGQLVGYPVFRLGSRERGEGSRGQGSGLVGVRRFIDLVQEALVAALAELGVEAHVRPGYVGAWVGGEVRSAKCEGRSKRAEVPTYRAQVPDSQCPIASPRLPRKIASIGVAVSRRVTYHGLALNVTTDLGWFDLMNPCGLMQVRMTSVRNEGGEDRRQEAYAAVVRGFESAFGLRFQRNLPRSLTSLTNGLSNSAISSA